MRLSSAALSSSIAWIQKPRMRAYTTSRWWDIPLVQELKGIRQAFNCFSQVLSDGSKNVTFVEISSLW